MLNDITLGQYFPIKSCIHSLDPRFKLVFTILYIILIFFADSALGYLSVFILTFFVVKLSKIKFTVILKSVKPLSVIIIITALVNFFLTGGDDILWQYSFIKITQRGIVNAVNMALRLIFLVIGTSILTYTTSPIMLTDAIEKLLSPLSKIKVPVHELAMMMSIALRFIPTLIEETQKIIMAQKARCANFECGNILKRAKSLIPVLIPLFMSSFRRADELATAMECRCYRGGEGRTSMKQFKVSQKDIVALLVMILFTLVIICINIFNLNIMGY